MHDRVAVPVAPRLAGEMVHEVLLVARLTVKGPCCSVTVTVEDPLEPALTMTEVGLAAIVKSCTVNVTVVVAVWVPAVPVTVTV